MSAEDAQWKERPYDKAQAESLRAFLPFASDAPEHADIVSRLLVARGIDAQTVAAFLQPTIEPLICATDHFPGMAEAVDVIVPFIRDGRKIVVFGDYDADGVCASALLVRALRKLGATAEAFIPERFTEGYGMTAAALTRLFAEHPDVQLVVTVDNGIASHAEVRDLKARGVAVVVTDHHLPGETLPEPDALVDPRVAAVPGGDALCGAGVAFFLVSGLARALACREKISGPLLVLAAVATVADIVPLTGLNRALVVQGLKLFSSCAPVGLRELFTRASRWADRPSARDFSFLLAPRINAAGRMATAKTAYELLMAEDREVARELARQVDTFNVDRRGRETAVVEEAKSQITGSPDAIVVCGKDWHAGVLGIVASRLVDLYRVPVAVATAGDDALALARGSVRAPEGYDVHAALTAAQAALARFGGHVSAGGFTVRAGAFEQFRTCFTEACRRQRETACDAATVWFDGWVEPSCLTLPFYQTLQMFEPCGEGNPEPLFGLRNVAFTNIRIMGADGRHASFTFADESLPRAVWWNCGEQVAALRKHAGARYDVLFTLLPSSFGGAEHVELRVAAVRPTVYAKDVD